MAIFQVKSTATVKSVQRWRKGRILFEIEDTLKREVEQKMVRYQEKTKWELAVILIQLWRGNGT